MPVSIPRDLQSKLEFYRSVLFSDTAPKFEDALSIYKSINEDRSYLLIRPDPIVIRYLNENVFNVLWYDFLHYLDHEEQYTFSFRFLKSDYIEVRGLPYGTFHHGGCFKLSLIYWGMNGGLNSRGHYAESNPIAFMLPVLPRSIYNLDKEFLMFNDLFLSLRIVNRDTNPKIIIGDPFLNFQRDAETSSKVNPLYKVLYNAFFNKPGCSNNKLEPLWFYEAKSPDKSLVFPPSIPSRVYQDLGLARPTSSVV